VSVMLQQLLANRNRPASFRGIYAVCSAHPWVLRAAMQEAHAQRAPLLIEATCNQVNQFGGYTGMQPVDFVAMVKALADGEGFTESQLILGGDHLGPNPWQHLSAAEAMQNAETMVTAYVQAGFTKIHLDTSMPCADDPGPLSNQVIAERAARLCGAAERAAGKQKPLYIIGTEVPTPGGATEALTHLQVTARSAALTTLEVHRQVFADHGLEKVWPRIAGLVVQPGVEFNHDSVVFYEPEKARELVSVLRDNSPLVFEAHSTDYQLPQSYLDLVSDGFAILKVGPALTFAMREALFALAQIEEELLPAGICSHLPAALERAMLRAPGYWEKHYAGTRKEQKVLRRYSYSDRIRYYWTVSEVQNAVNQLLENLAAVRIPETLISAYLPEQYRRLRNSPGASKPEALVLDRIRQALEPYSCACAPLS